MGIWDLDGEGAERKPWTKREKWKVWHDEFGDKLEGKCPICKRNTIARDDFVMGHRKALASGGSNRLKNIKPICQSCNSLMSTMSMSEFTRIFGTASPAEKTTTARTTHKTTTKTSPTKKTGTTKKKKKRRRSIWDTPFDEM